MLVQESPATRTCPEIRAEYLAMPGLKLTDRQAQRLFRLDAAECDAAFQSLIDDGFLRRTSNGLFVRADLVDAEFVP